MCGRGHQVKFKDVKDLKQRKAGVARVEEAWTVYSALSM
jgi:hypothetical protein